MKDFYTLIKKEPLTLPSPRFNGERIKVRDGVSWAKPLKYVLDMGLAHKTVDARLGRALEILVFLDLMRNGYEVYYYEGIKQCDFVGYNREKQFFALQVSWEITKDNQEGEYSGLIEACKEYNLKKGMIITRDQEYTLRIESITIDIIPYTKWLLRVG